MVLSLKKVLIKNNKIIQEVNNARETLASSL